MSEEAGRVTRVAGPVVGAEGLSQVRLHDVARVGEAGLIGEVIRLESELATIQAYEDTSGLRLGEPVRGTGGPLSVELGPGLLGQVYDGLQRPLGVLASQGAGFLERGLETPPLDPQAEWEFEPSASEGEQLRPGDRLGRVLESQTIEHHIRVPPGLSGRLEELRRGRFKLSDVMARLSRDGHPVAELTLSQRWAIRQPRPVGERLSPVEPLITGTRVLDALFPVAKGGTAVVPGGFGTGKTVIQHTLSRWSDADVVVYVGCGERGNEMAEVLAEFPELEDPRTGASLMERTVLIANTSNMPVAAREASIYTGITIAEYYRDMGYDVLMLADSTSRWAEALREVSGRLEEMPGEEGYPAYLEARLAQFYERAGRVVPLQGDPDRPGSVTIVGAVSPPGGDFSEPVTQSSMRIGGTFWSLDHDLSRRRHFPAVSWSDSYSAYNFRDWYEQQLAEDWSDLVAQARAILQREGELQEIVELVGPDALSEADQELLLVARLLREDFLQQSALDEVDRFSPLQKTVGMLRAILRFHGLAQEALQRGQELDSLRQIPELDRIARMKEIPDEQAPDELDQLLDDLEHRFRRRRGEQAGERG